MLQLSELRVRLDQMTHRVVSRMKDRSRFPLNLPVYEPGAVPIRGRHCVSFLQFSIEGLEAYHASLGRYDYPDQAPLLPAPRAPTPAIRQVQHPALPRLRDRTTDDLLAFYQALLPRLCAPGDDPNTYGETVYVDADLLELLHERINLGRYVAQVKADQDPRVLGLVGDPSRLAAALKDPAREAVLIGAARAIAVRYDLDADLTADVFTWIMQKTLLVEVAYLQQIAADSAASA
jgi:chorismate mutase